MARPFSGFRRLVAIVVVLVAGPSFGFLVAGIDASLVSRNKSPNLPQPPAVSTSCPSSPMLPEFSSRRPRSSWF
jgi:hypothetical protein